LQFKKDDFVFALDFQDNIYTLCWPLKEFDLIIRIAEDMANPISTNSGVIPCIVIFALETRFNPISVFSKIEIELPGSSTIML
jgi:hypothetical protein